MKLYGLIGYPLGHSFSEKYFTEKFKVETLKDCSYKNFPLQCIDLLPSLLNEEPLLCGFNVTIPYKVEILRYLSSTDPVAKAVGAVNVVTVIHGTDGITLKGYNTDAPAFRYTIENLTERDVRSALILGSGGASAAVVYILEQIGLTVKCVSRTGAKGNLTYDDLTPSIIRQNDLIINATPVGMYPSVSECPMIDYDSLDSHHILYDLIYNPLKTEFLRKGEERGCKIINGLEMLHKQAELAWSIWSDFR